MMLEDTYVRLLKRTDEHLRAAFDRYDVSHAQPPQTAERSDAGGT
jgi:hypothetical protein